MANLDDDLDPHTQRHKYVQHDVDLDLDVGDPEPGDEDDAWAEAQTPEDYVMSSPEAMASAIDQARHDQ